jgi:hypothetical protein
MDQSNDEFGLDLGSFDIRDFVPEGEGGSMFDDQARDKAARLQAQVNAQAQRSLMQSPAQYYGFQSVSDPSNPNPNGNGTASPNNGNNNNNPAGLSSLSLEQLNMLLNVGLAQPMMAQDPHQGGQSAGGGAGSGSALANSADALKEQLAQQIKLQQLQQLQNHILQQQVRLLCLHRLHPLIKSGTVADSIAYRWSEGNGYQGCSAVAHSRYVIFRKYPPHRTNRRSATPKHGRLAGWLPPHLDRIF